MGEIFESTAMGVDVVGALVMLIGFVLATLGFGRALRFVGKRENIEAMQLIRCNFGLYLLLGLELMIVSDLLHSVVSRSLDDLYILVILVAVRTLIGYFLNQEIREIKGDMSV